MELPKYATVLLPRKLNRLLARRFAALNVEAMRAIYHDVLLYASQFIKPLEAWEEKLARPDYWHFVLLAPNAVTGVMSLEEGQWVGAFVLQGPLSAEDYNFFNLAKIRPDAQGHETRWLGLKLYLKEQHRNLEAMRLLREATMGHIESHTRATYKHMPSQSVTARLQSGAFYDTTSHKYHSTSGAQAVAELTRRQDLEYDGYSEDTLKEFLIEEPEELVSTIFEYVIHLTIGKPSRDWL